MAEPSRVMDDVAEAIMGAAEDDPAVFFRDVDTAVRHAARRVIRNEVRRKPVVVPVISYLD